MSVTPDHAAAATRSAVHELGGAFAEDPKTLRRARELGLTGWSFYVAGRGGALGEVRPDTVAAALGFIAPDAVRDGWATARRVIPPSQAAAPHLARRRRLRADLVTDRIVGEAYQSLDVAERGELVRLFDEAVKHLRAAAVP